jgi:hypothetical protein
MRSLSRRRVRSMANCVVPDAAPATRSGGQHATPHQRDSICVGCLPAGRNERWNVAIFPDAIVTPSWVRILGKAGASLEELP